MTFTDQTVANGWIPVQQLSEVLKATDVDSAVESAARIVNMTSDVAKTPRYAASGIDIVAEGAEIPLKTATLDEVQLDVVKFADRFATSSEDKEDAIVDFFNTAVSDWINRYKIALDHAALGTVGAQNGGTRPFTSVYQAAGSGNRQTTAGALTYEHLVEAIGELENSTARKGDLVIFAHPSQQMALRGLKDSDGNFVIDPLTRLGSGTPTLFGHDVHWTLGATSATAFSDAPSGNPLLIVAAKNELILGKRKGPEALISSEAQWANDNLEVKVRSRRAFTVASGDAVRVVEITAGA